MADVSLKHRLEFYAYRGLSGALSRLPVPVANGASAVLGFLGGSLLRIRRKVVDDNLRHAFPDETPAWRNRVARQSYRHLVRETMNFERLSRLGPEQVLREVRLEGLKEVRAELEAGRGLIIASGHLGNWELGGSAVAASGIPITAVAVRQKNPLFNEYVVNSRARLGMEIVHRYLGWRPLMQALKRGRVLALVADQNAGAAGIFVEFMGRPAATARGPAVLSLRIGTPLFLGLCIRNPDPAEAGGYRYTVRFLRVPVDLPAGVDPPQEDQVQALVQQCQSLLEEAVREYPAQYFWQHRRWKYRPPEEGSAGA